MTHYCNCHVCKNSVAQPKERAQGKAEEILGDEIYEMEPGSKLAHWSSVDFEKMYSTEIMLFKQLGNLQRVGCSFYYYPGAVPAQRPKQLKLLGLGGQYCYVIDPPLGEDLLVYKKVGGQTPEVAVVLGCGGYITFNNAKKGTHYKQVGTHPFP